MPSDLSSNLDYSDYLKDKEEKQPLVDNERYEPVPEDAEGAKMCDICCDYFNQKDFFGLPDCPEDHKYCRNCMSDHLKAKIEDGQVVKICCMYH